MNKSKQIIKLKIKLKFFDMSNPFS
jgi:hypothetical protein